jgi:hypothetical protein
MVVRVIALKYVLLLFLLENELEEDHLTTFPLPSSSAPRAKAQSKLKLGDPPHTQLFLDGGRVFYSRI